jgi:uncharacterized protein (TIGR02646 family)
LPFSPLKKLSKKGNVVVELSHILPEPASLAAHRSKHPNGPWNTLPDSPEKAELRQQLNTEQDGLCIYCESALDPNDGHVEHIIARAANASLTFDYKNLAHCCSSRTHCGHAKDSLALPIEPRPGCSDFFQLSFLTGYLFADRQLGPTDNQRAQVSLDVLGLNREPGLVRRRQQEAETVCALARNSHNDVDDYLRTAPFRWSLRRLIA